MSDREQENGEDAIDESGRNLTQQEIDDRGASQAPADADWEEVPMSEVVPEDEDRDGDGAMEGALADEDDGGTGADDGGPGSQNM
jgi:hypothetical protein